MNDSQIQPGTRLAFIRFYGKPHMTVTEAFVEKVYKNGNFTIKGMTDGQWRQCSGVDSGWYARLTGNRYFSSHKTLRIWDEKIDKLIDECFEAHIRNHVMSGLMKKLNAVFNKDWNPLTKEEITTMHETIDAAMTRKRAKEEAEMVRWKNESV